MALNNIYKYKKAIFFFSRKQLTLLLIVMLLSIIGMIFILTENKLNKNILENTDSELIEKKNKEENNTNMIKYNDELQFKDTNVLCPENFVAIPGGFDVDGNGINESWFCVMKYEAKKGKNNEPISIPEKRPWVSISQNEAREKCQSLGKGYSLITNKQWIQIAKIAAHVDENWISGKVGNGSLIRGHSDKNPYKTLEASTDDNDGFYKTGTNADDSQKRTFIIKNGVLGYDSNFSSNYQGVVWDIAGNIWEWNNDTIDCSAGYPCINMPQPSNSQNYELNEFTESGKYFKTFELIRPNSYWNSTENIGRVYSAGNKPVPEGNQHGLARGGIWYDENDAGLFTAYFGIAPSFSKYTIGFRCTYVPNFES
ncbi:MAG: hypothetical protein ACOC16_00535 [Nanoarchaeota archaeon]